MLWPAPLGLQVWLRLRASAFGCVGAATGRADLVAVGAGTGYRVHFSVVPDQVQAYGRDAPPDATGKADGADGRMETSYQLIED